MRFEPIFVGAFAVLGFCLSGCSWSSQDLSGTQKITLEEACDRAVEHGSTVQFAARLKRLKREQKEAVTLTSLPDLENLPPSTPPARMAELWFEAFENALIYNYFYQSENMTEAEQNVRLRENELLRGKTTSLYWLLIEDIQQLRSGKFSAEEQAERRKRVSAQAFELAVHLGSTEHPMPKEEFKYPISGSLKTLLKEAGSHRAAMPDLCGNSTAVESALTLYNELKKAPDYSYGKMVRILFYLPTERLRTDDGSLTKEMDALLFLLGNAAELDLLLEARKKAAKADKDQQLKIEALLLTARGFGAAQKSQLSAKNIREAEKRMRELFRKL